MYSIIPLAGPDCERVFTEIEGESFIQYALKSRAWVKNGEASTADLIFVLREFPRLKELQTLLSQWYPKSQTVVISQLTQGALLSAAAGAALIRDFTRPIIVDLIDILYESSFSPTALFTQQPNLLGLIPYFHSTNPKYSYLALKNDQVTQAAEKKVISSHASAGTYFFRDAPTFWHAVAGMTKDPSTYAYRDNLFVCPSFNVLLPLGDVKGVAVHVYNEVSLRFHL
jgi:hypothetical protein